jgi:methionine aminotransferase
MAAILATVHQGDEVIVIEPSYDCYVPAIRLAGGQAIFVGMTPPTEARPYFSVNWDKVKDSITNKTRMLIVNSPHNPTGSIFNTEDLNALESIVANTNIIVLSDEVYEHIVFDGAQHASVLLHPELRQRSFVCGSFGKTYHITGWKIGYCLAPPYLTQEFRKLHQWVTFSSATPLQYALADYLKTPAHYLGLSSFYQQKRDLFASYFKGSRWKILPSHGSFFQ